MIAETICEMLEHAGIAINGPNPWDMALSADSGAPMGWRRWQSYRRKSTPGGAFPASGEER